MAQSQAGQLGIADPLRLPFLRAAFLLLEEDGPGKTAAGGSSKRAKSNIDSASVAAGMRQLVSQMSAEERAAAKLRTARALLHEFDRLLSAGGEPPGTAFDPERLKRRPAQVQDDGAPRVGLISMPWMSPALPSIQLATLQSALRSKGMEADVHELFVDYAADIGLNLYNQLGNLLGYLPEWIFSRHYYGAETGDRLEEMFAQDPLSEIPWQGAGNTILRALEPVTARYLDRTMEETDWSRYDIVGFSLTISQLGASMALARLLKKKHPRMVIVFGGSQCAGEMGRAILGTCPYVDYAVHMEGEAILPELVRRIRAEGRLSGPMPGMSLRQPDGAVAAGPAGDLYPASERLPLDYDAYFHRLERLNLHGKMKPWIPFEGSRGCWWGQKSQCTFCGLHEIMKFRAWEAEPVLEELERLEQRYGVGRFYAMDLILPREYMRTLLPEVARRGHNWMFFWEIKSNVKRQEAETLAKAGVRWVQPGIESLDDDLLALMKKGVSALQNVQLLKWCEELSIFCGWNLLSGLPGEKQASYDRMAAMIPKLHHLRPPSGGGRFQLHRFSPYFDHPEQFGIRWTGAHPMYRYTFPLPQEEVDRLVYLHDFERLEGTQVDDSAVEAALRVWRSAYARGAKLTLTVLPDGSSQIRDTRRKGQPKRIALTAEETRLYLQMDAAVSRKSLGRAGAIADRWIGLEIALEVNGKVLALATCRNRPRHAEAPDWLHYAPPSGFVPLDSIQTADQPIMKGST